MGTKTFWVYVMTNRSGTLYVGFTGNLERRVHEHRNHLVPGFASKYRLDRLIHVESFSEVRDAIAREKQIKTWRRSHKLELIAASNPEWRDLAEEWFGPNNSG
jgi:putative endonuclease